MAFFLWFGLSCSSAWEPKYAPIMTDWAPLVSTNNPLPEYPRPQLVRSEWLNLNGLWEFQPGAANDPTPTNQTLSGTILVPFPMESALSGVAEHHARSWYRRKFTVPPSWAGKRILLHLDAVDWESEVYINGQSLGLHQGGYDAATYDITPRLSGNEAQELLVRVYDPTDAAGIPRGKQTLSPGGIMYTACSGIWQPVWLEPVPVTSISDLKLVPDIDTQKLRITTTVLGVTNGITVRAVARVGSSVVWSVTGAPGAELQLPVPNPTLWSPTNPFLYDLDVTLSSGGTQVDSVTSYFGMRKISLGTRNGFVKLLLNNEFVFQFGPLDQGFWPDGIYTAPTDDALRSDIEQTKLLGYNMIRKHIKVERPRWYYWADKLGMLVWQDMPSVNSYTGSPQPIMTNQFHSELMRMVRTHWNHPSIIQWVVFNESQGQHETAALVQAVKTLDPSRVVNEASGGTSFGSGDVLDWHSYPNPSCPASASQAVVCGEFGGVGLGITNHTWAPGWGYIAATNGSDLVAKFEDFCLQLSGFVQNNGLSAAVYTEITDVEIELNGFLTYDRKVRKPDPDRVRTAIASASTPVTVTTVVPTSQVSGQTWRYVTTAPAANWYASNFSDATWTNALGGFGGNNPPNTAGLIRTAWTSPDIWLRRTFNPGSLSTQQLSNLFFTVYHDEDVEIYINGVLAGSAAGYTTTYGLIPVTAAGRAALVPNTANVLAVHCHQTGGGQYIDVGITVRESTVAVPPTPVPPTPTGLRAAAGATGVTLGWSSSSGATTYNVKRSPVSGGPYTTIIAQPPVNCSTDTTGGAGVTNYYVVSAVNATGESGNSAEVAMAAPIPIPPAPRAWFRADAITGLSSGAAVATWADVSGNGFHAGQATASRRPTYVTGAMNGLPVVRFNAANSNYLAFSRPVEDDFTIICVYRSSQGVGTGTQFYQGVGLVNGEVPSVVNDFGLSLNANGRLLAGTGNPDTTVASSGTQFTDGQPHIVVFQRNRSTGAITLYVDGVAQGAATGGRQSLTAPGQLALGAQLTLNNHLSGDIAEVKLYGAALSDSERVAEENALRCKYGLGPGVPPTAPLAFSANAASRQVLLGWLPTVGASGYQVSWSDSYAGPYTQLAGNLTTNRFVHTNPAMGRTNYYRVAAYSACGTGTLTTPAGVFLPIPSVNVHVNTNSLTLAWPDWASDWRLWWATNLTPPVTWWTVTNPVSVSGGQITVTLPFRWGAEFFRLSNP